MPRIAIIGAGPAGLMAADVLARQADLLPSTVDGKKVEIFEAMPSVGRKFLMAGKGGMNITHAEPLPDFKARYGARAEQIAPLLDQFGPDQLRAWIGELGIATFVGTSGRVFPAEMKAAPLLRAWLHRLRQRGVQFHVRHRWLGWSAEGALRFMTADGEKTVMADVVVLALGGGSWKKLGSDGAWMPILAGRGVEVQPLKPSNCGFDVAWSRHFSERHAGQPVKTVIGRVGDQCLPGEFNITANGVEGGLIYALSAPLRDNLARHGEAALTLDLAPGRSLERLQNDLSRPRGRDSLSNHWRRCCGIDGVKAGLLREFCSSESLEVPAMLAQAIKSFKLPVIAPRPIDEAISTAGGVTFEAMNPGLMLNELPGVFCAGEMLDWEAPTGGYLLTACFSSGYAAGRSVLDFVSRMAPR